MIIPESRVFYGPMHIICIVPYVVPRSSPSWVKNESFYHTFLVLVLHLNNLNPLNDFTHKVHKLNLGVFRRFLTLQATVFCECIFWQYLVSNLIQTAESTRSWDRRQRPHWQRSNGSLYSHSGPDQG